MLKRLLLISLSLLSFCYTSSASKYPVSDALPNNFSGLRIVFSVDEDPSLSIMPFPNDVFWGILAEKFNLSSPQVYIPISEAKTPEEAALYALINSAHLKGLSPNMFITIPLSDEVRLVNVDGHYKLIDLSDLSHCVQGNSESCFSIDDTNRLVYRQYGRYLRFYPVDPLDPGHQYVFVLFKGIRSEDGRLLDKPWNYELFDSEHPLMGQLRLLEPIRKQFSYLYSVLHSVNNAITRDSVLILVPFKTTDKTFGVKSFVLMKTCLERYAKFGNNAVASCIESGFSPDYLVSYSNISSEIVGLVYAARMMFSYVYSHFGLGEQLCRIFVDDDRHIVKSFNVNDLFMLLSYYNSGDQEHLHNYMAQILNMRVYVPYAVYGKEHYDGSVLMYQHGLGGNKTYGGMAYQALAKLGTPKTVIAMDLPWHGDRTPPSGPCAKSGACFLTPNVPQDRINYYQAIVDQTVLMLATRAGCIDLDGNPSTVDVPSRFYYSGLSLGAITGSMFTALNYVDPSGGNLKVDKAVLNVGGANYAALVDEAERFPIQQLICEVMGGSSLTDNCTSEDKVRAFIANAKLSLGYALTMGILQTILDPSDPSWVVRGAVGYYNYKTNGTAGMPQVILQSAYKDTFVPNVSNEALARAFGYGTYSTVLGPADISNDTGWYMFGDENNWAVHSFIFVDGLYQLCGSDRNESLDTRKACLLNIYPELSPYASYIDPDAIESMADAAWYQTYQFLWGNGD